MERILLVDDEINILEGYRRKFRNTFELCLAQGPQEGLKVIGAEDSFAVVVSDFNMPGMNGVEFLRQIKEVAPDTVRIMLTGFADVTIAINAVNDGAVFRFLTKPCSQEDLTRAINDGIAQNRLIRAEKELLERTLTGSVRALIDLLALSNPNGMGKASRLRKYVCGVAEELQLAEAWKYEVAALLSPLNTLSWQIPPSSESKSDAVLNPTKDVEPTCPIPMGAQIMKNIPRLEDIVDMLTYQVANFDGSNSPDPKIVGEQIPLGARLLKVAQDFDALRENKLSISQAFGELQQHSERYDPHILATFETVFVPQTVVSSHPITITDLKPHMSLAKPVVDKHGATLLETGHELSDWMIKWLHMRAKAGEIEGTVEVVVTESMLTKKQSVNMPHSELSVSQA